jgi:hypothetical protein
MKYLLLLTLVACITNSEYKVHTVEGVMICYDYVDGKTLADCHNEKTKEKFTSITVGANDVIFKKRK